MKHTQESYIYLASPYASPDQNITDQRFYNAQFATASLLKRGLMVYSPIVHCHDLAVKHELPTDVNFWWKYNRCLLGQAKELLILTLDGWQKSSGIRKEARYAIEQQLPISYISLSECS